MIFPSFPETLLAPGMDVTAVHVVQAEYVGFVLLTSGNAGTCNVGSRERSGRAILLSGKPGGENPRPDIIPAQSKVGIRLQRSSGAYTAVQDLQSRFCVHETDNTVGERKPSRCKRQASRAQT
jgi:hypothetical protein